MLKGNSSPIYWLLMGVLWTLSMLLKLFLRKLWLPAALLGLLALGNYAMAVYLWRKGK